MADIAAPVNTSPNGPFSKDWTETIKMIAAACDQTTSHAAMSRIIGDEKNIKQVAATLLPQFPLKSMDFDNDNMLTKIELSSAITAAAIWANGDINRLKDAPASVLGDMVAAKKEMENHKLDHVPTTAAEIFCDMENKLAGKTSGSCHMKR